MKLVKKVSQNWKQMDGSCDLAKKINAYLSSSYISDRECPSDECFSYAEQFCNLPINLETQNIIKSVLTKSFWTASSWNSDSIELKQPAGLLDKQVNHIMDLIKNT